MADPEATLEPTKITAIVLASGLGTRFGGHKLLREISINHNPPLPIGIISALNIKPFVDHVICVVRPTDFLLKQKFEQHGFTIVDNPGFEQGLSSSIKAGIRMVSDNCPDNHYMICLGDMPYIKPDTYQTVIEKFRSKIKAHSDVIVRPIYTEKNKPGHPVIFSNSFETQLLDLTGDDGGKPIIKQHGFDSVEVNDSGVLADIDRETDIR